VLWSLASCLCFRVPQSTSFRHTTDVSGPQRGIDRLLTHPPLTFSAMLVGTDRFGISKLKDPPCAVCHIEDHHVQSIVNKQPKHVAEMRPPLLPPALGLQTHNWALPERIVWLWCLRAGSIIMSAGYFRERGVFPLGHTCGSQASC